MSQASQPIEGDQDNVSAGGESSPLDLQSAASRVKSADRTLEILEVLGATGHSMTMVELALQLKIPKSSLHALIHTLQARRWIEIEPVSGRISLGLRSLIVGSQYVESSDAVADAQPVLDWVSNQCGETVHFGRLDGTEIVYLAKRDSTHPLRLYSAVGRRLPAHATSIGKAVLSTYDESELTALLPARLEQLSPHTITNRAALLRDLAETRSRGYSIDNEEATLGLRCFGMPILSVTPAMYAISIAVPVARLSEDVEKQLIEVLSAATTQLKARAMILSRRLTQGDAAPPSRR